MKKLILLAMSAILITFASCNQNGKFDPEKSTTVTVYCPDSFHNSTRHNYAVLDTICIYNERGVKVGIGGYVGDYLVPYNGFIQLTYHGEDTDYDNGVLHKSQYQTDRYEVGTAKQMYIALYAAYECYNSYWNGRYDWYEPFSAVTNGKE